jgi:hypothetical protein
MAFMNDKAEVEYGKTLTRKILSECLEGNCESQYDQIVEIINATIARISSQEYYSASFTTASNLESSGHWQEYARMGTGCAIAVDLTDFQIIRNIDSCRLSNEV